MTPQEVYDLFQRHESTQYTGDVERPRDQRWVIACRCGFTASAPECDGVETAFGAHIINDPAWAVAFRATQEQETKKVTTMRQAFWRQVRKRPGVLYWHVVETVREWIRRARRDVWDSLPAVAATLKAHTPTIVSLPGPISGPLERQLIRCACGLEFHFIDAKAWHRHAAAMVMATIEPMEPR